MDFAGNRICAAEVLIPVDFETEMAMQATDTCRQIREATQAALGAQVEVRHGT